MKSVRFKRRSYSTHITDSSRCGDLLLVLKVYCLLVLVSVTCGRYIDVRLTSSPDDLDVDDDDDDEEFHYPGASPPQSTRAPSIRSTTTDYFGRVSGSSRRPADLTPHLSQAPEFRVPTHEAPRKILTPRWSTPTPHQLHATWERDEAVSECRECRRRFTFLNRRVSTCLLSTLLKAT